MTMMRYGSIYIATNKHTGEQYVGQTRQPVQKRWAAHWRTAICIAARKAKFQNALLEFGCEAFEVEEVFTAFDAEELNRAEIAMIAELQPSYNASKGGMGLRPVEVTETTKRKRSEAAKARWANPEWKAKTVQSIQRAGKTPEAVERGKKIAVIGSAARLKSVICVELNTAFVSITEAAHQLGLSGSGVRYAIARKIKARGCYTLQEVAL